MTPELIFIIFVILLALVFDFTNGMHDAANSIATIVSTGVLPPKIAVIWAAVFNFIAFLIFDTTVADTVGVGMINLKTVTVLVIFCGLLAAIVWNLFTWSKGLPTSSSHALIGGYAGAAVANAGFSAIIVSGWLKTLIFIVLAPTMGLFLGYLFKVAASWIAYKKSPPKVSQWSRILQLFSAALYSLGHGSNDAQKTIGIITGLLVAGGIMNKFDIPLWVILAAYTAIAAGTLSGGWRIIKTMGQKITKLKPIDGVCAETAAAISILSATSIGVPVSTTHVITGAISGTGAAPRIRAVRWNVALRIVWSWFFTIPAAALLGAVSFIFLKMNFLL